MQPNGHPLIHTQNPNPNPNGVIFDDLFSVSPSWPYDDSSFLAVRLRQQQLDSPLLPPLPLSLAANSDSNGVGFNTGQLQHLHHSQSFGGWQQTAVAGEASTGLISRGGGGRVAAPRQRIRARRGQATDPHSIAERLRRERIAERMKALQELVPNANKTDKASTLDEIIDYVRFLQLQVKVLSMSRLGGSAAVSPFVAERSAAASNEAISAAEDIVTKLIEEDMGSAMQYLQGKGLCLMPISLASAISATSPSVTGRIGSGIPTGGDARPPSPSMSVLTVQSVGGDNGICHSSGKDAA